MPNPSIDEVSRVLRQWIDEARVYIPGSPPHRDILRTVTRWLDNHLARFPRPELEASLLRKMISSERR